MSLEALKYLFDVAEAAQLITQFVANKTFAQYSGDPLVRSAVERQLGIIGEALNQLARRTPEIAEQIREYRRAIAFRNILIHGYANVDSEIVWRVINDNLPLMQEDVCRLQENLSSPS